VAAFDSAREDWVPAGFGRSAQRAATAMGFDAGSLYLYDLDRVLWASRDGGTLWERIATVPLPDGGSFYDDIEAEGKRLLLRYKRPYGIAAATGSADGGKTWRRFPAGADVHLQGGCFQWIDRDSLRSDCGPEAPDRAAAAPFLKLERLFAQDGGELFALADSGLFHYRAPDAHAAGGSWDAVDAFARAQGWILGGDLLSRQTAETVSWVSPGIARVVSIAPGRRTRRPPRARVGNPDSPWLERARRPDGRALPFPNR
jgi:hypothetical protein